MSLVLKTAPAVEPVSLTEAKLHLRVDVTADDTLIDGLITTARELVELIANRSLVTQTWLLRQDAFPNGSTIRLPRPPLISVTSIKYYDQADTEATVTASDYYVDPYSEPGIIYLKSTASWPGTVLRDINGVVIEFIAGYGAAAAVPNYYKQAMLLLIGEWYENREAIATTGAVPKELPMGVEALININRNFLP